MIDIFERLINRDFEDYNEICDTAADEIERLRDALTLILNGNSLAYAHEIAAKALEEKKYGPHPAAQE